MKCSYARQFARIQARVRAVFFTALHLACQLCPPGWHRLRPHRLAHGPAAFAENQPGRLGNLGRNVLTEGFNVMNWVNLENPESEASNPQFGVINSAGDPRILHLGLKFVF